MFRLKELKCIIYFLLLLFNWLCNKLFCRRIKITRKTFEIGNLYDYCHMHKEDCREIWQLYKVYNMSRHMFSFTSPSSIYFEFSGELVSGRDMELPPHPTRRYIPFMTALVFFWPTWSTPKMLRKHLKTNRSGYRSPRRGRNRTGECNVTRVQKRKRWRTTVLFLNNVWMCGISLSPGARPHRAATHSKCISGCQRSSGRHTKARPLCADLSQATPFLTPSPPLWPAFSEGMQRPPAMSGAGRRVRGRRPSGDRKGDARVVRDTCERDPTVQSVALVTIDGDKRVNGAGIVYPSYCGSWFFYTPDGREPAAVGSTASWKLRRTTSQLRAG